MAKKKAEGALRLTIEKAALAKGLAHIQGVVERRNTIPIVGNVLLVARDDTLTLTATDMDMEITEALPAAVQAPGAITVPAHTLHDIVRKLPDGAMVGLEALGGDNEVALRAGRANFALVALPADDFPRMADGAEPNAFTLGADDLRRLIDRTRFAVSTEETRYYLNGIYLHATQAAGVAVLRAVATDGHRLARMDMPLPQGAAGMPGVILPRKTILTLRKLLDAATDDVAITIAANRARFAFADLVLTTKLVDGSFPDYERVIPDGNDKIMAVDLKTFAATVDRVSIIQTDKSRAVALALVPGAITISANNPETGRATEEIDARYDGARMEIGFNARYLLDITEQIEGEAVTFAFADSGSPIVVTDAGAPGALFVLMPMRTTPMPAEDDAS